MKVRYLEHHPDEWLVGIAGLTPEQNGIYRTICDLIASTGGPIPIDDERLFRLLRANRNRIKRVITELLSAQKLVTIGSKLSNNRVISELERANNRSRIGAELAAKRWENNNLGYADGNARARNKTKNQEPRTIRDSSIDESRSSKRIAEQMIEAWNHECGPAGLRVVVKTTKARETACRARLKQEFSSSIDEWRMYLRRVSGSSFLLGNNPHGFKATFDWVLISGNLAKIVEGNYDDRSSAAVANGRLNDAGLLDGPTEPPPEIAGWEIRVDRPH